MEILPSPRKSKLDRVASWAGFAALFSCILAISYSLFLHWLRHPEAPYVANDEPPFGSQGYVVTSNVVAARALAFTKDGKILVAGFSTNSKQFDISVLRFLSDGKLDISFGERGISTIDLGGDEQIYALQVGPDERIWVAGEFSTELGEPRMGIACLLPNGHADPSFGKNGGKLISPKGASALARALVLQPDGKLLVAGFADRDFKRRFLAARLTPTGELDNSFGNNGFVETLVGATHSEAFSLARQEQGRVLLAGFSQHDDRFDFTLAGFTDSGRLDSDFGDKGIATANFESYSSYPYAMQVLPSGAILVGGATGNRENYDFALSQWSSRDVLDPSFGKKGRLSLPIGGSDDTLYALAVQPNGKIFAAGSSVVPGFAAAIGLAKFLPSGILDRWFGTGGRVLTAPKSFLPNAIGIQRNGKIVVAGNQIDPIVGNVGIFVARFLPDGSFDAP